MDYDMTPSEEAEADARAIEEATDNWLAEWSDDFNSDEWAKAAADEAYRQAQG